MTDEPRDDDELAPDEPGDPDALSGFKSAAPEDVPPDEGDAGEAGHHAVR
jgi:hypothetical protein